MTSTGIDASTVAYGPLSGGNTIIINGTNFDTTTAIATAYSVTIDGNACVIVAPVTATQITCTVPAATSGAGAKNVVLTVAGDQIATFNGAYTYLLGVDILSVSPNYGKASGGDVITITANTGSSFQPQAFGGTTVIIGGVDGVGGNSCAVDYNTDFSATSLKCTTPASSVTSITASEVYVYTIGGSDAEAGAFTYVPTPTVTAVARTGGANGGYLKASGEAAELTVTGTNFAAAALGGTTVTVGGLACTVNYADSFSETSLKCNISGTHAAGKVSATATNINGTSTALPNAIEYLAAPGAISLNPTTAAVDGTTVVTLTEANSALRNVNDISVISSFTVDGAQVTPTVTADGTLTFVAPAHSAGDVTVSLTTYGGGPVTTTLKYVAAPVISSVSLPYGKVGDQVTITGTGFFAGTGANAITGLTIGGVDLSSNYTVNSDTQITVTIPSSITSIGIYTAANVVVSVSIGGQTVNSATNSNTTWTLLPLPDPTAIVSTTYSNPGHYLKTNTSGATVTISGKNFQTGTYGTTTVTIDGNKDCDNVGITGQLNDQTLTCTAPNISAAGLKNVVVGTKGGDASALQVDYLDAPTITNVSPDVFSTSGGSVTITGANFQDHASTPANIVTIKFDGSDICSPATTPCALGTGTAMTTLPQSTAGTHTVAVHTPVGSASSTVTYVAPPTVTEVGKSTELGIAYGVAGDSFEITGSNFEYPTNTSAVTGITVGGINVANYSVTGPGKITIVLPGPLSGLQNIVVTTTYGTSISAGALGIDAVYYVDTPTISSISTSAGGHYLKTSETGQTVTITGTNFQTGTYGNTTITIDGQTCTISATPTPTDTAVTCIAPNIALAGLKDVVLTTAGGSVGNAQVDYLDVPVVTTVTNSSTSNNQFPEAGGTAVIAGNNFVDHATPTATKVVTQVDFDGTTICDSDTGTTAIPDCPSLNGDGTITVTLPSGTQGVHTVKVYTPAGASTEIENVTYVPTVSVTSVGQSIDTAVSYGKAGDSFEITGTGFIGYDHTDGTTKNLVSGITVGGEAVTTYSVTSAHKITVVLPDKTPPLTGLQNVVVTTATYGSTISSGTQGVDAVYYLNAPTLTEIRKEGTDPGSGNTFSAQGATAVTLTGTNYKISDKSMVVSVKVDGTVTLTCSAPTSETSMNCSLPSGLAAGEHTVVVTTYGGASAPLTFYTVNAPTGISVDPILGSTLGGEPAEVTGTSFRNANNVGVVTDVKFDTTSVSSITVTSATALDTTTPAHAAGQVNVSVTNPAGTGTGTNAFEYQAPLVFASYEQGGTFMTITGSGFKYGSTVRVGGVECTNVVVRDSTTITCTSPPKSVGTYNIEVIDPPAATDGTDDMQNWGG
jgi:hypothetical protein